MELEMSEGGKNEDIEPTEKFRGGEPDSFCIEADFYEWQGKFAVGTIRMAVDRYFLGNVNCASDIASAGRWARTLFEDRQTATLYELERVDASYIAWFFHGRHVIPRFPRNIIIPSVEPPWPDMKYGYQRNHLHIVGEAALRDTASIVRLKQFDNRDRIVAYEYDSESLYETTVNSEWLDCLLLEFVDWAGGLRRHRIEGR